MELDAWQKQILETQGNIVLRSGRQVGKSTVVAILAGDFAVKNPRKSIMIISATERQAYLLFSKVLAYIYDNQKATIKMGKDRPTKSEIRLKNGSIIRCLPTGTDGLGIRGYTVDLLIADEAAFIPPDVWPAITPMLATTGGKQILLSTPFGTEGYFYKCFFDPSFTSFHLNSIEVAESRAEPQRSDMLAYFERERQRMSEIEFMQEYLGEFISELKQVFPDNIIKDAMVLTRRERIIPLRIYTLGVDVARQGDDPSTFEVLDCTNSTYEQVENFVTRKTFTTETVDFIQSLEAQYYFKKIYIDDGGLGVAVFDPLLRSDKTKRKVVAINNASRPLNRDNTHRKKILKEDLYANLRSLLERGKLKLLKDDEIFLSLKSCQYSIDEKTKRLKIFGTNTHITEGLARAAWYATEKKLNIWVR